LAEGRPTYELELGAEEGQGLAWLHAHAEVLERATLAEGGSRLLVRIARERSDELRRKFPQAKAKRLSEASVIENAEARALKRAGPP
jgi:GTP-binding protein HflX